MSRHSITLPLLIVLCASCAPIDSDSENNSALTQTPTFVEASGWEQVSILVNGAKTEIDNMGHFRTRPTACYREQDGATPLADWNQLAKNLNTAIQLEPLAEPKCIPDSNEDRSARYTFYSFYQPVEVTAGNKKRTLFESRGNELCSTIPEKDVVLAIAQALLNIAKTAYSEDCDSARNMAIHNSRAFNDITASPSPSPSFSPSPIPSWMPEPKKPSPTPKPTKGKQKSPPAQKGEQKAKQKDHEPPIWDDPARGDSYPGEVPGETMEGY